jgi:hypothetical protein
MKSNLFQIVSFKLVPKLPERWKRLGSVLDEIVFVVWILHLIVITPMITIHEGLHILGMFCYGTYPSKCKMKVLWFTFDHYVVIVPNRRLERKARWWIANIIFIIPISAIIFPFLQPNLIIWCLYVMYCGIMESGLILPSVIDKSYVENLSIDEFLERKVTIKT